MLLLLLLAKGAPIGRRDPVRRRDVWLGFLQLSPRITTSCWWRAACGARGRGVLKALADPAVRAKISALGMCRLS